MTQALAVFMERHHARLAGSARFERPTLRMDPTLLLPALPDPTVQFGTAEDELPLLLRIKRSRDLGPHLQAPVPVRIHPVGVPGGHIHSRQAFAVACPLSQLPAALLDHPNILLVDGGPLLIDGKQTVARVIADPKSELVRTP